MQQTLGAGERRHLLKPVAAALVASAVVALPGCSVAVKPHTTISARSLEDTIAKDLMANYNIPQPLVRCPASVPARIGARLSCSTELDGQTLVVKVDITGAHGLARLQPGSAVLTKGTAEAQLAASLAAKLGKGVEVFCTGPALLVVSPRHNFNCQADSAGVRRQIVVTVTDLSGMLSYRVLPYQE